jgi:hypothetical protein
MKNLHVIPTDKSGRVGRFVDTQELILRSGKDIPRGENVNICITSDEEIKEGDWFYCPTADLVNQCESDYHSKKLIKPKRFKIILTTDPDLIKDGVQSIDDEFLNWFVNNPSCEEIEVKDIRTIPALQLGIPNGHLMYKIIIPKEESKQELLPDFKLTKNIFDFVTDLSDTKKEESTLESAKTDWDSLIGAGLDEPLTSWDEIKKHVELINDNIAEFDKAAIEYFKRKGKFKQDLNDAMHEAHQTGSAMKQETIEEFAKNHLTNNTKDFEFGYASKFWYFAIDLIKTGANWQQERMYSEEEVGKLVYNIIGEYGKQYGIMIDGAKLNELFEQFKKK